MKKVNLLFFILSLGGGGAEMHLLRLVNNLDPEKFEISLAVARGGGSYEIQLKKHITVYRFSENNNSSSTLSMLRSIIPLRKLVTIKKPQVVCSFLDNANIVTCLAVLCLSNRPKLILGIQNPPSIDLTSGTLLNRVLLKLAYFLYPKADALVALSKSVGEDVRQLLPSISDRLHVIYNAGLDESLSLKSSEKVLEELASKDTTSIVACGRLVPQKGFSYLIKAFEKVRSRKKAKLWILGEGYLRSELETLVSSLNLNDDVFFLGFKSNPYKYMSKADIFVLSSIYEGFGNVVVEAMACGVPVVATDSPGGVKEILDSGRYGVLCQSKNSNALADAILALLNDSSYRTHLSESGKKRALDFDAKIVARSYEQLFINILT
jgi:glycosyltransferase involved in cell wall biosynthesis